MPKGIRKRRTKNFKNLPQDIIDLIDRIADEHSNKVFGYFTKDDLKQEIWLICLESLNTYNEDRGKLEHFLRVIVKNKLVNKFKNITKSIKIPCLGCQHYRKSKKFPDDCAEYGITRDTECQYWKRYLKTSNSRNALLNFQAEKPIERESVNMIDVVLESKELKEFLEGKIDRSYLCDLNVLASNGRLNMAKWRKLKEEIDRVMKNNANSFIDLTIEGNRNATTNTEKE